jgi:TolA-binding protein
MRHVLLLILVMALAACASGPRIEEDPTIQLLEQRASQIEPMALAPLPRSEAVKNYRDLAQSTENEALKVMALERLADLDLEQKQAAIAGEGSGKAEAAEAEEDVGSAIRQYERLLELYPDYAGNDRILYQLARAYELNGELDKTLDALTRLVTQYPNYKNLDEIQFRRGELLFAFKDFEQAELAYNAVLTRGEKGSFYGRSLFKKGWAVFKQGHTARSLKSYFGVLDRTFAGGRDLPDFSRSELELLEDTLRIVSLSFSYLKGAESVTQFFQDYGERDYAFRVYERLADLYLTQERPLDSADVFLQFVEHYPMNAHAPLFMVRIIDIYKQEGLAQEILQAKADLVTAYGIGTPFWDKHDKTLLAQIKPHIESNLDDLSTYYHAQAQKNKKPADYRLAAHWYRTYVRSFPNGKKTPRMNMLLAESLWESGDIAAAEKEYEKTAYGYPLHKDSAEAGYAALLAIRKQIDMLEPRERGPKRVAAIGEAKRFATYFYTDKRAIPAMSKAAEELLDLKAYTQAVATAHYVVGSVPQASDELRRINWAIIAKGEFELGLYAEAELASLERLRLSPLDDKEYEVHMERMAAAIYKQGEEARAANKHAEAAKHFLRVAKLTPQSKIRANADYDAATELYVLGDWARAIPLLKAFVQHYPGHKLRSGADEKLALAYEKSGDWGRAAEAYDVLYRKETDSNKKRLLLWQMAEFYEKAKRDRDAIAIYKRYVKTFASPFDDALEARNRLATIYQKLGEKGSRQYWLQKIIELHEQGPATDRSLYLAASAQLELAGPTYDAYHEVRLVEPLKQNLKKKKSLMQTSIDAFTKAANFGIEAVTTASTFRIAEIYYEFSKALFSSERPKGLSAEELEQYDILLEEQAFPFEEKAIEVFEVNAQRATTGVYDEWVQKSFAKLSKLSPIRYAKTEKSEAFSHDMQ